MVNGEALRFVGNVNVQNGSGRRHRSGWDCNKSIPEELKKAQGLNVSDISEWTIPRLGSISRNAVVKNRKRPAMPDELCVKRFGPSEKVAKKKKMKVVDMCT